MKDTKTVKTNEPVTERKLSESITARFIFWLSKFSTCTKRKRNKGEKS